MELFGYTVHLLVLVILLSYAAYRQHQREQRTSLVLRPPEEANQLEILDDEIHDFDQETTADTYYGFRRSFLVVYSLAIAADWLQV